MFQRIAIAIALFAPASLAACDGDDEVDICDDDLDCDDGFICEITGQDDGICIEDLGE